MAFKSFPKAMGLVALGLDDDYIEVSQLINDYFPNYFNFPLFQGSK